MQRRSTVDDSVVGEGRAKSGVGGQEARSAGARCGANLADLLIQLVLTLYLARGRGAARGLSGLSAGDIRCR